jgi:hypothetical protein
MIPFTTSREKENFIPPITPHPQHDQQQAEDTARYRPRDSQLAESHLLRCPNSVLLKIIS